MGKHPDPKCGWPVCFQVEDSLVKHCVVVMVTLCDADKMLLSQGTSIAWTCPLQWPVCGEVTSCGL
jgi:hypothetical protein